MNKLTILILFLTGCATGYPTGGFHDKDDYIKWLEFRVYTEGEAFDRCENLKSKNEDIVGDLTSQLNRQEKMIKFIEKVLPELKLKKFETAQPEEKK